MIVIGTTTVDSVSYLKISVSANVISLGGNTISQHGFCWGIASNPDISGTHSSLGPLSNTGKFTEQLANLISNTKYYIRPYLKYANGVLYGIQIDTTTLKLNLPAITTTDISNKTQTTATSGGNVTSDGGSQITARGVCWSASPDPIVSGSHTTNGSGTGIYVSNLTGLTPNTFYYVRAYATNSVGTSYGNQVMFRTPIVCGSNVTHGGVNYQTIQIGAQCWFKENLNIGNRINGSQNQTNNSTIEKYCYDDNVANCYTYGGLYQWDEMMQYVTTEGAKGLCPDGWHIPTDLEWCTLTRNIDLTVNCNAMGYIGTDAGYKMKSTSGWNNNGNGNNSSGFTALPAGDWNTVAGTFGRLGIETTFWTSTVYNTAIAWDRSLNSSQFGVSRNYYYKTNGFSVRCLQD
jgi:uncharacterized protein (TIGR02145 family)